MLGFARKKPPFGIAQIGKSFRNEITPGNFIFRTREFEQMEMEFFVPPDRGRAAGTRTGSSERERWYTELGIRPDHLRVRPHDADELSHYSSATSDVEYLFPIGWSELEGIANRGDFDLTQHAKFSGEKLEYFDQQTKERYVPHVIEPAAGADRATLAFLVDSYEVEEVEGRQRTVLRLHPRLAPVKVAVLPLVSKEGMPEKAREIFQDLRRASPPSSTRAARSASATAARTRSAPPGASPSTTRRWRTTPSPSATATPWSRSGSRSRASATSWSRASKPALAQPQAGLSAARTAARSASPKAERPLRSNAARNRPSTERNGDMAYEMKIRGTEHEVKVRSPWAVALLPIITLGIYHLVWWYKINKELKAYGEARATTSVRTRPTRCWPCSPAGSSSSRR